MNAIDSNSFIYDIGDHLNIRSSDYLYYESVVESTIKAAILNRHEKKMYHILSSDNSFSLIERDGVDYELFLKAFDGDFRDGYFVLVSQDVIYAKYGYII